MSLGRFSGSSTMNWRRLPAMSILAAGLISAGGGAAMYEASALDGATKQAGYEVSPVTESGVTYGFSITTDGSDDRDQVPDDGCFNARASATGQVYPRVLEIVGADGERIHVEFIGSCVRPG